MNKRLSSTLVTALSRVL